MKADLKEKPTRPPSGWRAATADNGGAPRNGAHIYPNSATAPFFINVKDKMSSTPPRERRNGYAVFGKVISGMDVVDKIRAVPTAPGDVPVTPVTIKKASLEK